MLADPAGVGNLRADTLEPLFDAQYWRERCELHEAIGGRGSAWFIDSGKRQWALRHFRRGGLIARVSKDRYVWAGEHRVRAFTEFRLLELLYGRGISVPQPVAARYSRSGLFYRCDLLTQRITGALPLSAALASNRLPEAAWRAVGALIAQLHREGVDHADLNAHNILIGGRGEASVIDFDRGRVREGGHWRTGNLLRLRRSLLKLARHWPTERFTAQDWAWLEAGYNLP